MFSNETQFNDDFLFFFFILLTGNGLSTMNPDSNSILATSSPIVGEANYSQIIPSPPSNLQFLLPRSESYVFNDGGSGKLFSDAASIRSLASIGVGSTDGRKMIIRRVPNSPAELLSIVNPPA